MVKIITDTTSCLSSEFARKYDIPVIPQVINFGNESFLEGVDMSIADFMLRLKASPEHGYLSVLQAHVPEQGQALADSLKARLGLTDQVPVYNMPPAIVTHGGPGILGVGFFV